MKFAIEGNQRHFFHKNKSLEVEGLFKPAELVELNLLIEKTLTDRIKKKFGKTLLLPEEIFPLTYDLFRGNNDLKKIILSSRFAHIASELIEHRPIRFGFDELFETVSLFSKERDGFNPYKTLMSKPVSLEEITSIHGVLCGMMICLSGSRVENETQSIFSSKAGNVVFFEKDALIDFTQLVNDEKKRYLLVVYTHATSIYAYQENDPQTHQFKNLGYVFGDRLNDKLNPIVYR